MVYDIITINLNKAAKRSIINYTRGEWGIIY